MFNARNLTVSLGNRFILKKLSDILSFFIFLYKCVNNTQFTKFA